MSWERILRWTCDECGAIVDRTAYGLPEGWKCIPRGVTGTTHRCAVCLGKTPPKWPRVAAVLQEARDEYGYSDWDPPWGIEGWIKLARDKNGVWRKAFGVALLDKIEAAAALDEAKRKTA